MSAHIGFVSTRFAGTDGVSLEAAKWARVLEQDGYRCFWFAGELDRARAHSLLAPKAHFKHAQIKYISDQVFGQSRRNPVITEMIHVLRASLKKRLREFIRRFDIDLLIVENALTIPMNLPLGLALAETISETQIPAIAHHHDFFWERKRFGVNAVNEFLATAFPADLPTIRHVVINSPARRELAHRRGIAATLIPNVLDFNRPPRVDDDQIRQLRNAIGLAADDLMVLQPTRLIKRKGIEHAVELVKALDLPRCKLVISHEDGDEGAGYSAWLRAQAANHGVDLRLIDQHVISPYCETAGADKAVSLWTVYAAADLVTFCSLYEGFGNGLLEAIYFRKPIILNRYEIFVHDIEPLGFDFITMDGYLSREVVEAARDLLTSGDAYYAAPETNYALAQRHFSYQTLRGRLMPILEELIGAEPSQVYLPSTPFPIPGHKDLPMRIAV